MKTNHLLLAAIAALALMATFNSCKEKEEEFEFPYEDVKLLVEDGTVFTSAYDLVNTDFFSGDAESIWVTETKDYNALSGGSIYNRLDVNNCVKDGIQPFTKYYWYVDAEDKNGEKGFSEIRTFYYAPAPTIEQHNVEGDWAIVLKWEHNDVFEDAQVTMTPNKDCNYDKNPIKVPAGQDSCYISAGTLDNQKYQIYHCWWDEANGKYYDPVIYDFTLTINCNCSGDIIPVSTSAKGIFLNTDGYVADRDFNVYRYGKIGNRIWMLDDLRAIPTDTTRCHIVKLESGLELVLYDNTYGYFVWQQEELIPKGFHRATNEDWLDLENLFGVEENEENSHWQSVQIYSGNINKYIADAEGVSKNNYEHWYYNNYQSIYDWYCGKGSKIRDFLIADYEWKDINDATKRLQGGHTFNAHPAGIPYKTDNMNIENPYIGYGVAFYPNRIIWSGCDGIGRMITYSELDNGEKTIHYELWRCVKDE